LEKEKCYLISLGNIITKIDGLNIKENDNNQNKNNKTNEINNNIKEILSIEITDENLKKIEESLNIDISYFSNLKDYEDLISKDDYAK
jgi:hypothetical protein